MNKRSFVIFMMFSCILYLFFQAQKNNQKSASYDHKSHKMQKVQPSRSIASTQPVVKSRTKANKSSLKLDKKKVPFDDVEVISSRVMPENRNQVVKREFLLKTSFKYSKIKRVENWKQGKMIGVNHYVAEHILVKVTPQNLEQFSALLKKHGLKIKGQKRGNLFLVSLVGDEIESLEKTLKTVREDLGRESIVSADAIFSI